MRDWELGVVVDQDRGRGESVLEVSEGCPCFSVKIPGGVLSEESGQGGDDFRVPMDEPSIEVGEPQEYLDIVH